MKRILVSNDDGIHAPGIRALVEAIGDLAEVTVVAPLTEQSAASHALTLHHPLRIKQVEDRQYAVEGTPTDCVLLAIREFLPELPDLVVSGINQGPNLGEDVLYSGTVAAAMEGSLLGVASVAFSLASWRHKDFRGASQVARQIVERLLTKNLPTQFLLNVNIPPVPPQEFAGYRITRLGSRVYNDAIIKKTDPRGRDYYWIGGAEPTWKTTPESDFGAVEEGFVSMTPLRLDMTDPAGFEFLAGLELGQNDGT